MNFSRTSFQSNTNIAHRNKSSVISTLLELIKYKMDVIQFVESLGHWKSLSGADDLRN